MPTEENLHASIGPSSKGKDHLIRNSKPFIYLFHLLFNFLHSKINDKFLFIQSPTKVSRFSIDDSGESDTESSEEESKDEFHDEDVEQYEAISADAFNDEEVPGHNDPGNDGQQQPDLGYESATEQESFLAQQDALREVFNEDSSEDEDSA